MTDSTIIADRVRERLETLGLSGAEADRRTDVSHGYISDLLRGRKKAPRGDTLVRLADVLDCDPGYLIGSQDAPRIVHRNGGSTLSGTIEAGAWRDPAGDVAAGRKTHLLPDRRYPPENQAHFIVRGDGLMPFAIPNEAFLTAVPVASTRQGAGVLLDGDLVVAALGPPAGPREISVYRIGREGGRVVGFSVAGVAVFETDGATARHLTDPAIPVRLIGVASRVMRDLV